MSRFPCGTYEALHLIASDRQRQRVVRRQKAGRASTAIGSAVDGVVARLEIGDGRAVALSRALGPERQCDQIQPCVFVFDNRVSRLDTFDGQRSSALPDWNYQLPFLPMKVEDLESEAGRLDDDVSLRAKLWATDGHGARSRANFASSCASKAGLGERLLVPRRRRDAAEPAAETAALRWR